ncbi:MAG: hypothetical protein J6N95_08150, partial [Bacilli bacterium]|nr:hypothetical protein [Bacilli bacterium]
AKKDFDHYEVSNWAKNDGVSYSTHNINYWANMEYYGCGLGAAGYIGDVRYKNTINLDKYLKGEYVEEKETLTVKDKYTYEIMLRLRSNKLGLNIQSIKEKYGVNLYDKWETIKELINEGYLIQHQGEIYPTYEGMMILDQIILKLI